MITPICRRDETERVGKDAADYKDGNGDSALFHLRMPAPLVKFAQCERLLYELTLLDCKKETKLLLPRTFICISASLSLVGVLRDGCGCLRAQLGRPSDGANSVLLLLHLSPAFSKVASP